MSTLADQAIARQVKAKALSLGFDLAGIAAAHASVYRGYFEQWLAANKHGEMAYLANRFAERTDPATYFPGARSVVCVALNYHTTLENRPPNQAKVARYALGDDYHEIIKDRLHELADWIRATFPGVRTRAAVDSAPVMEKELAARAGIGWLAKNTCIINPQVGSWLLLGEVLTTLDLPSDDPAIDRCGTCTRCLDACPTGAINPATPYQLDAAKCIAYLTIEHRGDISPDLQHQTGDWLFGCDICQDVCPWNRRAPDSADPALRPRFPTGTLDPDAVLHWDTEQYRQTLRHSAMKRVKLPILHRNAAIVVGNRDGARRE